MDHQLYVSVLQDFSMTVLGVITTTNNNLYIMSYVLFYFCLLHLKGQILYNHIAIVGTIATSED